MFTINRDDEGISIDFKGESVLYWNQQEWEEDPTVVYAIAKAIEQALTEPEKLYDFCVSKNLIEV